MSPQTWRVLETLATGTEQLICKEFARAEEIPCWDQLRSGSRKKKKSAVCFPVVQCRRRPPPGKNSGPWAARPRAKPRRAHRTPTGDPRYAADPLNEAPPRTNEYLSFPTNRG